MDNEKEISESVERAVMRFDALSVALAVAIATKADDNPGTSDLFDTQPMTVRLTLGDVRRAWRVMGLTKRLVIDTAPGGPRDRMARAMGESETNRQARAFEGVDAYGQSEEEKQSLRDAGRGHLVASDMADRADAARDAAKYEPHE